MAKMSPDDLKQLVIRRRDAAVEHLEGARRTDRLDAMRFYRGDNMSLYGNSSNGLSTVVSRDFMEAVESVLPGLIKPFVAGDETVRFEPTGPEDEEGAKQATEYINYLFQNHNDAVRVVYDFAKDGMMFRLGVAKVVHETVSDKQLETYTGLGPEEIDALEADKAREIVGDVMFDEETGGFEVRCSKTVERQTYRVYVIAENEFLFESQLATMDEGRFFGHRATKTVGDFIAIGLPKKKMLKLKSGETDEADDRFGEDSERDTGGEDDDIARLVTVDECYVRCDYEGTGVLGWRKVFMGATDSEMILDEEADDHPYEVWTPIPLPHKLVGMSFYDTTKDIQMNKTAIIRETNNALYLANRPMREVVEGQVNIEDLLSPSVGGIVRVKQPSMVRDLPSGGDGVIQQSLAMIEHLDGIREQRTGSTRYNQGMDADSLNKTASGIAMIQNASTQRQELIARHLAEGIKGIFKKMLGLVMRHGDQAEVIRLRGKWVEMNPKDWKAGYDMSVAVGLGTGNREQQVGQLMQMLEMDERIIQLQGGADGPIVTMPNIYEKLKRLTEAMGMKGIENYYTDPEAKEGEEQPEGPDPEQQAMEAQQAEQQQMMQAQQAQQQAEMQATIQVEMDKAQMAQQTELQKAEMAAQTELQKADMQAQADVQKAELAAQADDAKLQAQLLADEQKAALEVEKLRSAETIAQLNAETAERQIELEQWKAELAARTQLEAAQISANTTLQGAQMSALQADRQAVQPNFETNAETPDNGVLAAAIEGMSATIGELRKPRKILRDKSGKVTGVE